MPTSRRKSPNDGRYDRGEERARRFGELLRRWRKELGKGAPSYRDIAGAVTAYTHHLTYDNEVRRVEGGRSGIAHLAKNDGELIEAYLYAWGKTSVEDWTEAFDAVGILPADMTKNDLLLGMAAMHGRGALGGAA